MEELTKKCTKCGEVKSLSAFNKNKSKSSGYQSFCKYCQSSCNNIYRHDNKHKLKAYENTCRDNLSNNYVLSQLGIPISDCPPELIELKRAQLRLIRAIKN